MPGDARSRRGRSSVTPQAPSMSSSGRKRRAPEPFESPVPERHKVRQSRRRKREPSPPLASDMDSYSEGSVEAPQPKHERQKGPPTRTLRKSNSDEKPFSSSYKSIAAPPRPLKRREWLKTLNHMSQTHLCPGTFIGIEDITLVKLLFCLTGKNPTCEMSDFLAASKWDFRAQMKSFYDRCEKKIVQKVELWDVDDVSVINAMADGFGWLDSWMVEESEVKAARNLDLTMQKYTDGIHASLNTLMAGFAPYSFSCTKNFTEINL
jgi:hypothetical protein